MLFRSGSTRKHLNDYRGSNSRLDELQAAFLRVKLTRLDAWNARRSAIAQAYLKSIDPSRFSLPVVSECSEPNWHLFVVRSSRRDADIAEFARRGIDTAIHYPLAPPYQNAYADLCSVPRLEIATRLQNEVLSLPIGPHMPQSHVATVIAAANAPADWRAIGEISGHAVVN